MIITQYETIRGPSSIPITVDDVKRWVYRYVGFVDDDDRIAPLILDAIETFQTQTGLMVCNQRLKWHPWRFGNRNPEYCQGSEMYLPFGNNSDIVVEYRDTAGNIQTFPATDYKVIASENSNSILSLGFEKSWPEPEASMSDSISIIFDTGWPVGDIWLPTNDYGIGDTMLPTKLKQRGMAYVCETAGQSGAAIPNLTTETGATSPDGAGTLVWECVGKTVPSDIFNALLAYCGEKMAETGITKNYPNLNIMSMQWDNIVGNRRLRLA